MGTFSAEGSVAQTTGRPLPLGYRDLGESSSGGPLLVFVHGSMDTGQGLELLAAELPGCRLRTYDRRGYGSSLTAGEPAATLEQHVDDLIQVIGSGECIVVAHSLGGLIALGAAERYPEGIRAVFAYETPLPWAEWWPKLDLPASGEADQAVIQRAAERFLRRIVGDERWETLPSARRARMLSWGPAWAEELGDAVRGGAPFDLARIVVPVQSAHGSASHWRHLRASAQLAAETGHPALVLDGASHNAPRRKGSGFGGMVRGFVASCTG